MKNEKGVMASWLVCLTLDQVIQVQVLAGDIMLCSWDTLLTLFLSTQVYKWVTTTLMLGVTLH